MHTKRVNRLSAVVYSVGERRWRTALTIVLAICGWVCLRDPGNYRWLDSLDLAIHETGHLVFAFGGETLRSSTGAQTQPQAGSTTRAPGITGAGHS